ncbi:BON domain-containing protein [Nisaea sp.]|uniref:BON domain-containing protein n=1 Tax=Nisaea sp. TaxID=2024842 RepID=UPI0032ED85EE
MRVSAIMTVALAAAFLAVALPGCTSTASTESTGEYIDDSVINSKIRAQLVADKDLNVFKIDVATYKGLVQLSGFVPTEMAKARAATVASRVAGVVGVRNDLIIKE